MIRQNQVNCIHQRFVCSGGHNIWWKLPSTPPFYFGKSASSYHCWEIIMLWMEAFPLCSAASLILAVFLKALRPQAYTHLNHWTFSLFQPLTTTPLILCLYPFPFIIRHRATPPPPTIRMNMALSGLFFLKTTNKLKVMRGLLSVFIAERFLFCFFFLFWPASGDTVVGRGGWKNN